MSSAMTTMVADFSKRGGPGAFKHVNRADLVQQLVLRAQSPNRIDQGQAPLCGPAAFLYNIARKNPMAYMKYVIDLFEHGSAWLGKMHVEPSDDCKASSAWQGKMAAADWVALAGLRDSKNAVLDFDGPSDSVAGITSARSLQRWFQQCGYFSGTSRDTNSLSDKSLWTLLLAHQHQLSGGHPCLMVGDNVITGQPRGRAIPNHWVVLTSAVQIGKPSWNGPPSASALVARGKQAVDADKSLLEQQLQFEIFTWGRTRFIHSMTVAHFLDYFYGYVIAR